MTYFSPTDALDSGRAERESHPQEVADLRRRIAGELQAAFSRFLYEEHGQRAEPDPVLATLFLGLSDQLASVYEAIGETLPLAVIDELLRGLALPTRRAQPGQAVVQFQTVDERERLTRARQIVAHRSGGRELIFSLDQPLRLAPVALVFAAVYEPSAGSGSGRLVTVAGAEPSPGIPLLLETRPLAQPGAPPTLYMAIRAEDRDYDLGGLGLFIDAGPPTSRVARALRRSPWHVLRDGAAGPSGVVHEDGVLRVDPQSTGGPTQLVWANAPSLAMPGKAADDHAARWPAFNGHYDSSIWLLPPMPKERQYTSAAPAAVADAARDMLPDEYREALDDRCMWIQVPIDPNVRGVADAIRRVGVNCMTASNVYPWGAEHVVFEERGTVLTLAPGHDAERHVLDVLRVNGSTGEDYLPLNESLDRTDVGRYRVRLPLVEFFPRRDGDRVDRHVAVDLLLTDGAAAADPNGVTFVRVDREGPNELLNVKALTPIVGGASPASATAARARFASQVRSRDRIVTAGDIDVALRALDARVKWVRVDPPIAEADITGLRRVERVSVGVDAMAMSGDAEMRELERQMAAELQLGSTIGTSFRVRVTAHA